MAVRGAYFFAPYQRLGCRMADEPMARPPAPHQPAHPLLRDDPDDVRQVAAAVTPPFLDRHKPKPGRFPKGVLNHPSADTSPRGKLIDAPIALPMLAHLIPDDA